MYLPMPLHEGTFLPIKEQESRSGVAVGFMMQEVCIVKLYVNNP